MTIRAWIPGLAQRGGLRVHSGRKNCVFLLTGYCHECNMFGNSETQYISIMGKRGLTVYFIASNSVLCLCACVSADSRFLASLIRLVADENRSDERYIQYTLSLVWVELTSRNPYAAKCRKPTCLSLPLSLSFSILCLSVCLLTSFFS